MQLNKTSHNEWCNKLAGGEIHPKVLIESAINESYRFHWHPLGFILCKLSEEENKKIRLHIWPKHEGKPQNPTWSIHDHIFDMTSWVLLGEIQNIEYNLDRNMARNQFYNVRYDNEQSILERTTSVFTLKEAKRVKARKGQKYTVNAGILHQSTSIADNISITVCETIDILPRAPLVVGTIKGEEVYRYSRTEVPSDILNNLINKI